MTPDKQERVTLGRPGPDDEWIVISSVGAESARKSGWEVRTFTPESEDNLESLHAGMDSLKRAMDRYGEEAARADKAEVRAEAAESELKRAEEERDVRFADLRRAENEVRELRETLRGISELMHRVDLRDWVGSADGRVSFGEARTRIDELVAPEPREEGDTDDASGDSQDPQANTDVTEGPSCTCVGKRYGYDPECPDHGTYGRSLPEPDYDHAEAERTKQGASGSKSNLAAELPEVCPTCGSDEPAWPYGPPLTAEQLSAVALSPCLDPFHSPDSDG